MPKIYIEEDAKDPKSCACLADDPEECLSLRIFGVFPSPSSERGESCPCACHEEHFYGDDYEDIEAMQSIAEAETDACMQAEEMEREALGVEEEYKRGQYDGSGE